MKPPRHICKRKPWQNPAPRSVFRNPADQESDARWEHQWEEEQAKRKASQEAKPETP